MERILKTYEAFYKGKNINEQIVFIGPPLVRKEIFETLDKNKKLLFLKEGEGTSIWITDKIIKENRYLLAGASCAHIAFSFAKYIGADPIIFVGQDLAFTKEGITHSSGVEIKAVDELKDVYAWVDGIDGEKLPTNWAFKNFLVWFENEILKDNSGREYIDCTEGGAYKKGTKVMKLEEAINKYLNEDIERLYEVVPKESNLDEKYLETVKVLKVLEKDIKHLSDEAKKHNKKLNDFLNKKYNERDRVTLDRNIEKGMKLLNLNYKVEKFILGDRLRVGMFQPVLTSAVIEVRKLGTDIDFEVIKENMRIQGRMNSNIITGCKILLEVISDLINQITSDEEYISLKLQNGGE